MQLKWTSKALADLARLYEFLAPANKGAAVHAVQALVKAPTILLTNPRIGEQLFQFEPREVRRILVGQYEMRYEIQDEIIYVLRLWHTREERKRNGAYVSEQERDRLTQEGWLTRTLASHRPSSRPSVGRQSRYCCSVVGVSLLVLFWFCLVFAVLV